MTGPGGSATTVRGLLITADPGQAVQNVDVATGVPLNDALNEHTGGWHHAYEPVRSTPGTVAYYRIDLESADSVTGSANPRFRRVLGWFIDGPVVVLGAPVDGRPTDLTAASAAAIREEMAR